MDGGACVAELQHMGSGAERPAGRAEWTEAPGATGQAHGADTSSTLARSLTQQEDHRGWQSIQWMRPHLSV